MKRLVILALLLLIIPVYVNSSFANVSLTVKNNDGTSDTLDIQNNAGTIVSWFDKSGNLIVGQGQMVTVGSSGIIFPNSGRTFGTTLVAGSNSVNTTSVLPTSSALLAGKNITNTWTALQTYNSGITMSGSNFTLGSNSITTQNFMFKQSTIDGNNAMIATSISGNAAGMIGMFPSGSSHNTGIIFSRAGDIITNWEHLIIGSDIQNANEYDIQVTKAGSGSLRSLAVYMFGTKEASFDSGNTISTFVPLNLGGTVTWDTNGNSGASTIAVTNSPCTHTSVQWLATKLNNGTTEYMLGCH